MYAENIVFSVCKGTCKRAILRIWSRNAAVSTGRLALRCAAKAATYECHMGGDISRRFFPPRRKHQRGPWRRVPLSKASHAHRWSGDSRSAHSRRSSACENELSKTKGTASFIPSTLQKKKKCWEQGKNRWELSHLKNLLDESFRGYIFAYPEAVTYKYIDQSRR